MKRNFKFSNTYIKAASVHNTLARVEKAAVIGSLGITVVKLLAAVVMEQTKISKR